MKLFQYRGRNFYPGKLIGISKIQVFKVVDPTHPYDHLFGFTLLFQGNNIRIDDFACVHKATIAKEDLIKGLSNYQWSHPFNN